MIKELINLANKLDQKGLRKEADQLDRVIKKIAQEISVSYFAPNPSNYGSKKDLECFAEITSEYGSKNYHWNGSNWSQTDKEIPSNFSIQDSCPSGVKELNIGSIREDELP